VVADGGPPIHPDQAQRLETPGEQRPGGAFGGSPAAGPRRRPVAEFGGLRRAVQTPQVDAADQPGTVEDAHRNRFVLGQQDRHVGDEPLGVGHRKGRRQVRPGRQHRILAGCVHGLGVRRTPRPEEQFAGTHLERFHAVILPGNVRAHHRVADRIKMRCQRIRRSFRTVYAVNRRLGSRVAEEDAYDGSADCLGEC
jgi:hypothetical protein